MRGDHEEIMGEDQGLVVTYGRLLNEDRFIHVYH